MEQIEAGKSEAHWSHPLLIVLVFGPGVAVGAGMLALMLAVLLGLVR